LILDRGFIDGQAISRCKEDWGIDVVIPIRKDMDLWALMSTSCRQDPLRLLDYYGQRTAIEERHRQLKCFYDLSEFRSRSFNAIAAQVVMVLLTYTLRQWQLWKFLEETLAHLTPETLAHQLRLLRQWIVIYRGLA
jgi:hypothetical protein